MISKTPDPIDTHVGQRLRLRRMLSGITQEKLGDALGVTFQQVQKYEKGSNRISASRLQHVANLLDVPVSFFFEGTPQSGTSSPNLTGSNSPDDLYRMLSTPEGIHLAKVFAGIEDERVRRKLIELAEALSAQGGR